MTTQLRSQQRQQKNLMRLGQNLKKVKTRLTVLRTPLLVANATSFPFNDVIREPLASSPTVFGLTW